MHYEVHDTPLLLLHGGPFDIHQQFGELLRGKLAERPIDPPTTEEAARSSAIHRQYLQRTTP